MHDAKLRNMNCPVVGGAFTSSVLPVKIVMGRRPLAKLTNLHKKDTNLHQTLSDGISASGWEELASLGWEAVSENHPHIQMSFTRINQLGEFSPEQLTVRVSIDMEVGSINLELGEWISCVFYDHIVIPLNESKELRQSIVSAIKDAAAFDETKLFSNLLLSNLVSLESVIHAATEFSGWLSSQPRNAY